MFKKNQISTWIGIILLSGMFLMGQDTWPPQPVCTDLDGDGYGDPASSSCVHPEQDCDDADPGVNPGASESSFGDPACMDGADNDCDGLVDSDDPGCWECSVSEDCEDGNPCTDELCLVDGTCHFINNTDPCDDSDPCTMDDFCAAGECTGLPLDDDGDSFTSDTCGGDDCDDSDPGINPGVTEASHGDPLCTDGIDNDCDGLTDIDDNGCQQCSIPEDCDDGNPCTDQDCVDSVCVYGNNSEPCDDGNPCTMEDACSGGICSGDPLDDDGDTFVSNACGGDDCDDAIPEINPSAVEGPKSDPVCSDGMDNDCDGFIDGIDTGCWECTTPEDCDDGNACTDDYCLVDGTCLTLPNDENTCDDGNPCTLDDECSDGLCSGDPWDDDGDTFLSDGCGGGDCDDSNPDIFPGAPELCDGVDNQCPGEPGYGDVDEGCVAPMVSIPAGCFDMGDAFDEGESHELPVHNVCISAFQIDVYEVTNLQYIECVDDGACTLPYRTDSNSRATYYGDPAYDDFPVIWVDWNQATDYCAWAGKRLPTEAEWEYSARGGFSGKRYPWGDTISGSDANYYDSGDPWDNETSEVGYYSTNGYGLYDVTGNVWEWVNDGYQSDYYSVSPAIDPPGPAPGIYRVIRGGSWSYTPSHLRVSYRMNLIPIDRGSVIGFRCARGGAFGP
jgi:formylglycine-generating enzyme required for sulfatase activity